MFRWLNWRKNEIEEKDYSDLEERIENLEKGYEQLGNMYKGLEKSIENINNVLVEFGKNQKEILQYIQNNQSPKKTPKETTKSKRSTGSRKTRTSTQSMDSGFYPAYGVDPYSHMGAILTIGKAYEDKGRSGEEPMGYYRTMADLGAYLAMVLNGVKNSNAIVDIAKIGYPMFPVPEVREMKSKKKKK